MIKESFDNGKYTVIFEDNGRFRAERYGEPWRDLTGDGMILSMLYEVERLRIEIKELKESIAFENGTCKFKGEQNG